MRRGITSRRSDRFSRRERNVRRTPTRRIVVGTRLFTLLADGIIYGRSNKRRGQFVAVRASDGWLKWSTPGRDGNHASILQHGEYLLFLTDGGVLIVSKRTAEGFAEERRYELSQSATWSMPVFLPDGILVRDANSLRRLTWEQ
ncbi:MAG TPA: hypothetical protein VL919_13635 [Vicinamibacterales bacterium]|nr:hypothetical protein [Vicinamibacterales bacterium]